MSRLDEGRESLWILVVSPALWAAHFALCYLTASIWCAKLTGPGGSLFPVRLAIGIYTALALAGIGFIGAIGYRRHRLGGARPSHDLDTPQDRHRFLGYSAFLLSALSAVATVYSAMVALFAWRCP
jgi:hypothetical protein